MAAYNILGVYNAHSLHILTCYFSHQTVRQLGRVFVGEVQRDVVHKRLGCSNSWINRRLKSIEIRKDLTHEWKRHGLQEGVQFATLTDIIYQTWSDMTAKKYKQFKGLKKGKFAR